MKLGGNRWTAVSLLLLVGLISYAAIDFSQRDTSKPTPITRQPTAAPTAKPLRTFNGSITVGVNSTDPTSFSVYDDVGTVTGDVSIGNYATALEYAAPRLHTIGGFLDIRTALTGTVRFDALRKADSVNIYSENTLLIEFPVLVTAFRIDVEGNLTATFDALESIDFLHIQSIGQISVPMLVRIKRNATIDGELNAPSLRCCGEAQAVNDGCQDKPPCTITANVLAPLSTEMGHVKAVEIVHGMLNVGGISTGAQLTMHIQIAEQITIAGLPDLTNLYMPDLHTVQWLYVEGNLNLQELNVSTITRMPRLTIRNNVDSVSFDSLIEVDLLVLQGSFNNLDFPELTVAKEIFLDQNSASLFSKDNFPKLTCGTANENYSDWLTPCATSAPSSP